MPKNENDRNDHTDDHHHERARQPDARTSATDERAAT